MIKHEDAAHDTPIPKKLGHASKKWIVTKDGCFTIQKLGFLLKEKYQKN